MNDCNGKRELVTRTLRRAALTCRITNYNYVPYTAVVSNVKESWSQGDYVEQHSRAELQLRTINSSCIQRELVAMTLRKYKSRAKLQLHTIYSSCVQYPYRYIGYGGLLVDPVQRIWTNHVETCGRA